MTHRPSDDDHTVVPPQLDTSTVVFTGASDDLIEIDGTISGCDEYNREHGRFQVAGLIVEVGLTAAGTWAIGVAQVDEDVLVTAKVTDLSVVTRADGTPGYSMRLTLEVPADSTVLVLG